MDDKKMSHAIEKQPVRVKGSPRPVARVIGWIHARNGTIAIRENKFSSPFIGAQLGHYRAFIHADHARMMKLIAPICEKLRSTVQQLQILESAAPAAAGDTDVQALRAARNARRNQEQINKLKICKKKLEAQIQNYENIYQDRCGKARGIIESRLYAYRCGASGKMFREGLDIHVPAAADFPELPELLTAAEKQEVSNGIL